MALVTDPVFGGQPDVDITELDNADGTTAISIFPDPATTEGSLVMAIGITTTDTANNYYDLIQNDGTTDFSLGRITVNALAGKNAANAEPAVAALSPDDIPCLDVNGHLFVPNGHSLKLQAVNTITSTKVTHVTVLSASLTA